MSVRHVLCKNCGAEVSVQQSVCERCGVKYVMEAGKVVMNQLDMKRIELDEKMMRDHLPKRVFETLAPYPEERIIFEQRWPNLKRRFLVTSEKLIFYSENMADYWILPFDDFGGSVIGQESNSLTRLSNVSFFETLQLHDLKNRVLQKLPGTVPPNKGYLTLKTAIDDAYNLWRVKKTE